MMRKVRGAYVRTEETAPLYDWCAVLSVSSLAFFALCVVAFVQYRTLDTHDTIPATNAQTQSVFNEKKATEVLLLCREKKQRFDARVSMSVVIPDIGAVSARQTPLTVSATNTPITSVTASTGTERALPVE